MRRCDPKSSCREIAGSPGQRHQVEPWEKINLAERDRRAAHIHETDGEVDMAAIETFAQRAKRELDLQLDEELEGTFPASDPPKITRFSSKSREIANQQRKIATVPKDEG